MSERETPFDNSDEASALALRALELVVEEGWDLPPDYTIDDALKHMDAEKRAEYEAIMAILDQQGTPDE